MHFCLTALFAASGLLAVSRVAGGGYMCWPEPRRVPKEYIRQLPHSIRNIPPELFFRRSIQKMGTFIGSEPHPAGFTELPCGGIPHDRSTAQIASPGGSITVGWQIEVESQANCLVVLMCPGRGSERALWSGPCGQRVGRSDQIIRFPSDIQNSQFGDCFIQWRMETSAPETFVGCVDVIIGIPSGNTDFEPLPLPQPQPLPEPVTSSLPAPVPVPVVTSESVSAPTSTSTEILDTVTEISTSYITSIMTVTSPTTILVQTSLLTTATTSTIVTTSTMIIQVPQPSPVVMTSNGDTVTVTSTAFTTQIQVLTITSASTVTTLAPGVVTLAITDATTITFTSQEVFTSTSTSTSIGLTTVTASSLSSTLPPDKIDTSVSSVGLETSSCNCTVTVTATPTANGTDGQDDASTPSTRQPRKKHLYYSDATSSSTDSQASSPT